ncbi:MAG TPA: hypothetical protein VHL56_00925 [Candidatus Limnocylindrales bacterium]|jgi:hypothetical protein|nr:hypothetical protein [Candidatus Limnocylindrales bacterium]
MTEMTMDELRGWFAGRIPDDWFTGPVEVTVDREEILVVGALAEVAAAKDVSEGEAAAASESRIEGFREDTRATRMHIAEEAQRRFRRIVSWGVKLGGETELFTTAAVPVMTRLRMRERGVLDTLVDAGVARSRSEALAWCVRLVGDNESAWIESLRSALGGVTEARKAGPKPGRQN